MKHLWIDRLRSFALVGFLTVLLVSCGVVPSQGQETVAQPDGHLLDSVNFGDQSSESAHRLEATNSSVADSAELEAPDLHVSSVSATAGTAPEATLTEEGEWAVHREGEWIQYELSQPTTLDHIRIAWGRGQTFFFTIRTSRDGQNWNTVFDGQSRGSDESLERYNFDPVQAQHVRIVAHGRTGWWRRSHFFVSRVRIGDLSDPAAYAPARAYKPGLGQPSRRLLPVEGQWEGGSIRFDMNTNPDQQNYLTIKQWGSDSVMCPLYLRDGQGRWVAAPAKSIRDTGKNVVWTPIWEFAGGAGQGPLGVANGPFPGRFYYVTYPIPQEMTNGKSTVTLQLQAVGNSFDDPMVTASQGIYAAYTHTDPLSDFANAEKQGEPFEWGPGRSAPDGMSVEKKLMDDARMLANQLMKGRNLKVEDYRGLEALAQLYHAKWSDHYQDEKIVRMIRDAIDDYIHREARSNENEWGGAGWHLYGNLARAFTQVSDAFEKQGYLDEPFEGANRLGYAYGSRRSVYAKFFQKSLEWRRSESEGTRRRVANQVVSVDRSIYRLNRALQILSPELAMPKEQALRYMYEDVGLKPFYNAWPRHEWVRAVAEAGYPYHISTYEGNTREVGLGASYGEAEPSRFGRLAKEIGDEAYTERARKMTDARVIMTRRPANDGAGHAVLRRSVVYGWRGRDHSYPGPVAYADQPLLQAAALQDPVSLRLAELYLEHGRVFAEAMPRINQVIPRIEAYRTVKERLPTNERLPVEPGHEDFAWADEDLALFAARHDDALIKGSFFMDKAGVTPYGRIHFTTPKVDRIITLAIDTKFDAADHEYTISKNLPGDRVSVLGGRTRSAVSPPPDLIEAASEPPSSANAVSEPGGDQWMGSDERSSMADLYKARFGDYVVVMNRTQPGTYRAQKFQVDVDTDVEQALNLGTGEMIDMTKPITMEPRSTVVLYLGD